MNPADEYPESDTGVPPPPHRLIDRIIEHLRQRRGSEAANEQYRPSEDEQLVRSVIRQLRHNPIPTGLIGASLVWLLLAKDEAEVEDDTLGARIEDEVVGQIQGGFDYTGDRLRELSDRCPWVAGAILVASGLGAALFLPRERGSERGPR